MPISGFSVRAVEQAARNNLGLDLGGSFKNIEDAGVAQDSGNREFQRKAVAAMVALVFLYVCASIFIYGGELNSVVTRTRTNER